MTSIQKLLSISCEALAPEPGLFPEFLKKFALGSELFHLLEQKNGFYAFESALHVFPITFGSTEGLEAWNAESLWRDEYQDLADGLLLFAEDALQDQFCLSIKENSVFRFLAETGRTSFMADSIEHWADVILANSRRETRWPFVHDWQLKNGPLPLGKRLLPKIPFFLGGEYKIENFWAGNPLEGMRLKGDLAIQTRDLSDGAQVRLRVMPKPE